MLLRSLAAPLLQLQGSVLPERERGTLSLWEAPAASALLWCWWRQPGFAVCGVNAACRGRALPCLQLRSSPELILQGTENGKWGFKSLARLPKGSLCLRLSCGKGAKWKQHSMFCALHGCTMAMEALGDTFQK